jgi:hypothetical protein
MGEMLSRHSDSKFTRDWVNCLAFAEVYFRKPTKGNDRYIFAMYENAHNIPGMLGSLDVTKVFWKNF